MNRSVAVDDIKLELIEKTLKPKSGKKAKQLIILLHGIGADENDLFSLVPYFQDIMPDCYFASVRAPFNFDMAPMGYQWFSLQDRTEDNLLDGVSKAAIIFNNYIDKKMKELDLSEKDIALIGFSQGSMVSMHTALRREKPLAGVLAYSGALIAARLLNKELKAKPEICVIHGEADEVVPFQAFEEIIKVFKMLNISVKAYSQEGLGHGIDPAGLKIGMSFIKEIFGK